MDNYNQNSNTPSDQQNYAQPYNTSTEYSNTPEYSAPEYSTTPTYGATPEYAQPATPGYGASSTPDPVASDSPYGQPTYGQQPYDASQPSTGYGQPSYQQPPYQQQPYQQQPYTSQGTVPGKTKAIVSLVLGIVGVVLCWVPIVGLGCGLAGLLLGIGARKEMPVGQNGLATAGFICSIAGLAFGAIGTLVCLCTCLAVGNEMAAAGYGSFL